MKNIRKITFVFALGMLLTGCSDKFEPTESTIYVTSKGQVKAALMEEFDKAYYDFEELSQSVTEEVKAYNLDANEEVVTVDSLTQENGAVTLVMDYESVKDYRLFNDVLLFCGTYAEAVTAGYVPTELYDTEGMYAELSEEELAHMKVLVTEENVSIQTSGRIRYVSDHVTVLDKKLAMVVEAVQNHPAFILYK